jgi:hypothetical protein
MSKKEIQGYERSALLSACGTYRYSLVRSWTGGKGTCLFVMLNPSTATGEVDDPTIRKCVGYARAWGFSRLEVVNLFAFRATDPRNLQLARAKGQDVVGPENDANIAAAMERADRVIVAWGLDGVLYGRGSQVLAQLRLFDKPLLCFKLNSNGEPAHPLYQKGDAPLVPACPAPPGVADGSPA